MENVILTCLFMLVALLVGGIFLFCFAMIVRSSSNYDNARDLESTFVTNRMSRNAELIGLIYAIGKPNTSDGTYSEDKMQLWNLYKELDAEDKRLTKTENQIIINAEYGGY